ncbi:MAG: hypothetical protein EP329_03380 [Deltaproteobacteria bacterium]|nr:MAG: hypothetical protein EP329_03380 [Deltaproteobacteria bacterium]
MRGLVIAAAALIVAVATPAHAANDVELFGVLDAVGPLDGHGYDPRPVIRAVNALQPLGKERGVAFLRRYLEARPGASERGGLFLVVRTLLDPPQDHAGPVAPDACTPEQRAVTAGGCWRPPRLGAPYPQAPKDLRSLRYPGFVLGDVPLSLVSGYSLGGLPERLIDHLEALVPLGTWRARPLTPRPAGEVRYLFVHYGQWSLSDEVGRMVEAQLKRYERGPLLATPCLDLGLVCAPREAGSVESLRAAVDAPGLTVVTPLEAGDKRLLFAVLTWPTDSEAYVTVLAWSYTRHFDEWRLVLHQEVYGAPTVTPVYDAKRAAIVLDTGAPPQAPAAVVPLTHIPYSARD